MESFDFQKDKDRKAHFENLKIHLFFPRDLEGRKNEEYISFLRELNDDLLRSAKEAEKQYHPDENPLSMRDYIGLMPLSSMMKGYGDNKSDFDVVILGYRLQLNYSIFNCLERVVKEKAEEHKKIGHLVSVYYLNNLYSNITIHEDEEENYEYYSFVHPLAFPIIGKMDIVNYLRRKVMEKHKSLSRHDSESAQKGVNTCVECALYDDMVSRKDKMLERGMSEGQYNEILEARRKLWRMRITDMFEGRGVFSYLNNFEINEQIENQLQL